MDNARRDGGFALVSVLAILALILVLVLSVSTMLHVETRTSASGKNLLLARQNALTGLDLALSLLQEQAGRDQVVTFPATTFYPSKNVSNASGPLFDDPTFGYRSKATTAARKTYLTPSERRNWNNAIVSWWNSGRNPRWTGAVDSSLRRDSGVGAEQYGEPKRDQLPVWFVSGNEKISFNPETATTYPAGYQTPETTIPDPAPGNNSIWLVGNGTASVAAESPDGLDGRVKVVKQEIRGEASLAGHYAYWVGDESTKANFAVRDPWYDISNIDSVEYRNRLQVPQRVGWENITGFRPQSEGGNVTFSPNDPLLENIRTSTQIGLLESTNTQSVKDASRRAFHDLTAHSRSLLTDTALGGLKRDLTVFLEGGSSSLGLNDPIPDRALYSSTDPRFGSINDGFPRTTSTDGLPRWDAVKKWFDNDQSDRAPVLANFQLFTAFTHKNGELRMHFLPILMLWNPYDSPLASATYTVKVRQSFGLWHFGVGVLNPTYVDPPPPTKEVGDPPAPNPTYNSDDPFDLINGHKLGSYFLSPLQGFHSRPFESSSWFYRDFSKSIADDNNKFFKGFGVDFYYPKLMDWKMVAGAPVLTNPPLPNYKFAPFDRGTKTDGVPLPTDSQATWVTYSLASAFAPGEVKVFTVDSEQRVDPALLHSGSQSVSLENAFDMAYPESFWFPVASGLQKQPGVVPNDLDDVRWFGEILTSNTPGSFSMSLERGGKELWKYYYTGGGAQRSWLRSQYSGEIEVNSPSDPASWKKVYDFDVWQGMAKNISDARLRTSPIVGVANFGINPFLVSSYKIYDSGVGRFRMESLAENYRAFAHSNLSAQNLDPIDVLDLARSKDAQNNPFPGATHTFSTARRMDYRGTTPKWFDNQVSGDNGYTLFGWQDINSTFKTLGLTSAGIRQARADANLLSLGQLQQVNLAEYSWQPGFAIGNSEASPYVDRARAAGLTAYEIPSANDRANMLLDLGVRAPNTRMTFPNDARNRFLDLSFVLNENLWDRYFLSGIPQSGSLDTDNRTPLPNSRLRFRSEKVTTASEARNFRSASAHLENLGALNVNSTSVEAWKALLTAFRDLEIEGGGEKNPDKTVPVSRNLEPQEGPINFTDTTRTQSHYGANSSGDRNYRRLFFGFRYLTDTQIQSLAERIVDEVRLRGPFYSLADFVNRRLVSPDRSGSDDWLTARTRNLAPSVSGTYNHTHTIGSGYDPVKGMSGLNGALQRAVNLSGINGGMNYPFADDSNDRVFRVDKDLSSWPSTDYPMSVYPDAAYYLDTEHLAGVPVGEVGQLLSHAPGFVTQADLLAMIGPALTPRGDTFLVRAYGDSVSPGGKITGRAWLEAVVQRTPDFVDDSQSPETETAALNAINKKYGRKFRVVSIRWLNPEEI